MTDPVSRSQLKHAEGLRAAAEAVWHSLPLRDENATSESIASAAIEAFIEVLPTVWRCEEHKSDASEPTDGYAICWYYGNAVAQNPRVKIEPCRVRRVALVPMEEGGVR